MDASYDNQITITGTDEQILKLINIIIHYYKHFDISGQCDRKFIGPVDFEDVTDISEITKSDEVSKIIKSGSVFIASEFPIGFIYQQISACPCFNEMKAAAPDSYFHVIVTGESTYDTQKFECELKEGRYYEYSYSRPSDEDDDDDFLSNFSEYFHARVPYEYLIKALKLDKKIFTINNYNEFICWFSDNLSDEKVDLPYESVKKRSTNSIGIDENTYNKKFRSSIETIGCDFWQLFNPQEYI